ncbi:MAG: NADH:ubiquinone reductase (Na(+)-transporting) subunit D [Bacteroidales bacterium]|nr:NADH:ubiquinone reductase (Na(+)-transporting) subunit D [Bacteroidales bacterium]
MKKRTFLDPLFKTSPIPVLALGICSALAVTVKLEPALVMALAVTLVTGFSELILSLLRHTIPNRIRIIVQLMVVATLVILVDQVLKAYAWEISKQLSVFVGLIITNCIIMGRIEAFALKNKPLPSFIDGIANGLGYGMVLVVVAVVRELLGEGTLLGYSVVPEKWYVAAGGFYENNGFFILPPMALIVVGLMVWIYNAKNAKSVWNN